MNNTTRTLILTAMVMGVLSTVALADDFNKPGAQGGPPPIPVKELNLSEEQQDKIADLRMDQREEMIDLRARLEKQELQLKKLQREDSPNQKKIHAQIDRIGATRVEMAKLRADHHLEVRALLSPEQQKQMKEFKRQDMRKHDRSQRGHQPGRHSGGRGRF